MAKIEETNTETVKFQLNLALEDKYLLRYGTSPSLFIFKHLILLNPSLNLNKLCEGPLYKPKSQNKWVCTYKLNWPKEINFEASGVNPFQASYRSSLACVTWLEENHPLETPLENVTLSEENDVIISLIKESDSNNSNNVSSTNKITSENLNGIFSSNFLKKQLDLSCNVRNYSRKTSVDPAIDNNNEDLELIEPKRKILKAKRTLQINKSTSSINDNNNIVKVDLTTNDNNSSSTDQIEKKMVTLQINESTSSINDNNNNVEVDLTTNNNSSTEQIEKKIETDTKIYENMEQVLKMFPTPKQTLHNLYAELATVLKRRDLQINPQYKINRENKNSTTWSCTYHVLWPKDMKFVATGKNKKDVSSKTALVALTWLLQNKLMRKDGRAEIFDKQEISEMTKPVGKPIILDDLTIKDMKSIAGLYEEQMLPYIKKTRPNATEENNNENDSSMLKETTDIPYLGKRQKFLGLHTYTAKEHVQLPITLYKNEFMDLIKDNRVIILKGEPGCGKSTRIPQYVLEQWARNEGVVGEPCRIAVTQPRRIAAISLAERVANERSETVGDISGFHVRFRSNFNHSTARIIYCTTGILLRHIQSDPKLSSFTHVILDEAHERDVNTDLLMNLTRKALELNPKLKVIVMSATIDTTMFQEYFNNAPVMNIPGFTHPVKEHFLNHCKSLDLTKTAKMCESNIPSVIHEDVVKVIKYIHKNKREGAILCFLPGWDDISKISKLIPYSSDMTVLCLHSRLQDSEQYKIFSRPPPGIRKVILATNIAETSVTIDDVVYVVDSGIQKEQRFDFQKGVSIIDNCFISKSSMTQRKGRAGRVQPGESFHLYSQSTYDKFDTYTLPEMLKTSLTKIVLNSKIYSNNMNALEFMNQLPTPPEESAILSAVEELKDLDLLDEKENLTSLGKTLADFQLEPKLSKAMVNSVVYKCVTPVVDIVTLFSSDTELFASGIANKELSKSVKTQFCKTSDHIALMRVLEKYLELRDDGNRYKAEKFMSDTNLLSHKLSTMEKLRKVHFDYLYNGLYDILPLSDDFSNADELVKGVILSGVGTVLQRRNWDIVKGRYKKANVLLTRNNHKATITSDSVNCTKQTKYPSDFLLYLNETRSNIRRMTIIRESSLIPPLSVLLFMDKELEITTVTKNISDKIQSNDPVELCLKGTNIKFICDRQHAEAVITCKKNLSEVYKFYVYLLTEGGDYHPKVNESWQQILKTLSEILNRHKI